MRRYGSQRRRFTSEQVELLLAGRFFEYAKRYKVTLSTARRYGNIVRYPEDHGITIETEAPS